MWEMDGGDVVALIAKDDAAVPEDEGGKVTEERNIWPEVSEKKDRIVDGGDAHADEAVKVIWRISLGVNRRIGYIPKGPDQLVGGLCNLPSA